MDNMKELAEAKAAVDSDPNLRNLTRLRAAIAAARPALAAPEHAKRRRLGPYIGDGVDPVVVWLANYTRGEGITTEQLGERAGVSGGAIRAWINGRRSPTFSDLQACVNALGYEIKLKKVLT